MATAKRAGGLYYIPVGNPVTKHVAVDSEGVAIPDAPEMTEDTIPVAPGSGKTPAQEMAEALAAALRSSSTAGGPTVTGDGSRKAEPPTLAELPEFLKNLTTAEAVIAMATQDDRKGAEKIYEARLAELEQK